MSTESMVTQALEPCPNGCTTAAMMANAADGWYVRYVQCGCGWRSQEFVKRVPAEAEHKAVSAWNTRTAAQPEREAVDGRMLDVARRNLRTFIGLASFKSENDRGAALNCLDVIEADLSGLNALRSAR